MKTTIIIATIMLWAIGILVSSWLAQTNGFGTAQMGFIQSLSQATGIDIPASSSSLSPVGGIGSVVTHAWNYFILFMSALFLWFPNLWTGIWVWFYVCVIIPIDVGIVFSIVTIARGVPNL
jgi:hypothetical protein